MKTYLGGLSGNHLFLQRLLFPKQTRREWRERRRRQSSKSTTEPEIACSCCWNVANDETTNYAPGLFLPPTGEISKHKH